MRVKIGARCKLWGRARGLSLAVIHLTPSLAASCDTNTKYKDTNTKYTNTAYDEVPERLNMWYIFG